MKKLVLALLVALMCLGLAGCTKTDPEAKAVLDKITDVLKNESATIMDYENIRADYLKLSDELKKQVKTFSKFEEAEKAYADKKKTELAGVKGQQIYTSSKANSVNVIEVTDTGARNVTYVFNGNGIAKTNTVECDYLIDNDVLVLCLEGGNLVINGSFNGSKISVSSSGYFTADQVEKAIQGKWTYRETSLLGTRSEHNLVVKSGSGTYERAAEAYGYKDGSYYYYGPYQGTYKIHDGMVEFSFSHGKEFFFDCSGGKIHFYHYTHEFSAGSGLKGEDGYYKAFK